MKILLVNASGKQGGATGEILRILGGALAPKHDVKALCLGAYEIGYCEGCFTCYRTGYCAKEDGVDRIMTHMEEANAILVAAPSYWGDVPAQFKALIDRCTPYADTNPNRLVCLAPGKRGYAIALRTGNHPQECEHILSSVAHWCGHMGIKWVDGAYFCGISGREDIAARREEVLALADRWF